MSVVPTRRVIVVAIALSAATATNAFARHGGGHGSAAGHDTGHIHWPLLESVPMQQPHFNPSRPYTVPQSPETPVSPGSPGSVFGNH